MLKESSRRTFLKAAAMSLGTAALGRYARVHATPVEQPNLLFIMVDDLGKEWVSCYGAEEIETPNIDILARGGMQFENAYSMPQCTPSRTALLTGKYPWRTGYVNHWDVPRWGVGYFDWKQKQNTTFARLMKALGYVTCAAGKWQINDFRLEPQAMKKHGFDDWAMWTGFESGNPASKRRYADPYINTPEGSKSHKGQFGPDIFTEYLIGFMKRHKASPMCLYYPMVLPHGPLVATPDEPDVKQPADQHKAMVRYIDKLVGRLVDALDRLGLRERTIVVFTSDNGSSGHIFGTRNGRRFLGAKARKTEAGVCIPYIVNCPGLVPAGVRTDALTDLTDTLPTFVELGGGRVPKDLVVDGVSIAPVILGQRKESGREWIMSLGQGPAKLDRQGVRGMDDFAPRVIRDKRYKVWVSREKKINQLYDLENDPWEMRNLLQPGHQVPDGVLGKFQKVVKALPDIDARPLYEPRKRNPWDLHYQETGDVECT